MKLYDAIGKENVIMETAYGVWEHNTINDEDDYSLVLLMRPIADLLSGTVAELLQRNGILPKERVDVWSGTVTTSTGTEDVLVYIPDSWE